MALATPPGGVVPGQILAARSTKHAVPEQVPVGISNSPHAVSGRDVQGVAVWAPAGRESAATTSIAEMSGRFIGSAFGRMRWDGRTGVRRRPEMRGGSSLEADDGRAARQAAAGSAP